jgi:hypothetical protein
MFVVHATKLLKIKTYIKDKTPILQIKISFRKNVPLLSILPHLFLTNVVRDKFNHCFESQYKQGF